MICKVVLYVRFARLCKRSQGHAVLVGQGHVLRAERKQTREALVGGRQCWKRWYVVLCDALLSAVLR
eukprot:6210918-Pleurochrysis_carterae.AAC.5